MYERTIFENIHWILVLLAGLVASCGESLEDTYSDYTGDGPEQYLTKIYDLQGKPRWMSVELTWNLKLDPVGLLF